MTNFLKGHSWPHENKDEVWFWDTRRKFSQWLTNSKASFFFFLESSHTSGSEKQRNPYKRMITWTPGTGNKSVQYNTMILYPKKKKQKTVPFLTLQFSLWHLWLIYRSAFLSVLAGEGCLICSFPWEPSYQQQACSNTQAELTIRARGENNHQSLS